MRRWAAGTAVAMCVAACTTGAREGGAPAPRARAPLASTTSAAMQASAVTTASPTTAAPLVAVPVDALPQVPADPTALAAALAATETAIHDATTPLASVPALGAIEQRLVATVAAHPDWAAAVTAALPGTVRGFVGEAVVGDRELSAVPGPTPTAIPPWVIVAPRPSDELLADYRRAEAETGVPWTVLAAINLVETRMGRIVVASSADAQGPMQFLRPTWAEYGAGGDIHDPRDAIAAAGRLLRANGAPRDIAAALHHYNQSAHYARSVMAYAAAIAADPRAYYAFYGWRVYVTTTAGTFLLPEGFANGG
jgi:hypothetical protein